VIFDRTRENLTKASKFSFEDLVNRSINETLARSVNTVMTVLIALFAILIFGGESVRYFALALIIGVASGCYSSIFIASPIVVMWEKWNREKALKNS
ncbi:MAG: protein translocase subunit SecF, partial [Parcubacteria group bacterium]